MPSKSRPTACRPMKWLPGSSRSFDRNNERAETDSLVVVYAALVPVLRDQPGVVSVSFQRQSNVPLTGPVLLVSNHQSNLDPVLVGLACPRQLKYLARHGLFFWPFSVWIRSLGAVPIDRERGAIGGIRVTLELLKGGNAVLVFPEGSRTPDGKLHPHAAGVLPARATQRATVVPVAIDGAFAALPRGSFFARPARIRLAFGKPITNSQIEGMSDQQLVDAVHQQIVESLQVMTPCRGGCP